MRHEPRSRPSEPVPAGAGRLRGAFALLAPRAVRATLWLLAAAALALLLVPPRQATRLLVRSALADQPSEGPPCGTAGPADHSPPGLADWGDDHVDRPLPAFVEGGECLFCHRNEVGSSWQTNRHNLTIFDALPAGPERALLAAHAATAPVADQVELCLGGRRALRFLKRSAAPGRLDLLSTKATRSRGGGLRLARDSQPHWDGEKFADRCAGCHATAVDPADAAFTSLPLDCYVCHGDAPLEHANDASLVHLARIADDPPRVVVAICASCHVRFGRSRKTGRPYPTNFVAGDNLFRDFAIDWDRADDPQLNPGDRHVLATVRAVAVDGASRTCLDCHEVHASSTRRHRELADDASCAVCHPPGAPKSEPLRWETHSELCEY